MKLHLLLVLCFCFGLGVVASPGVNAADMKLDALLVWGTDDSKPPEGKDYKPVDPALKKKLKDLPLKWTNYFEVNRKALTAKAGEGRKEPLSEKCDLDFKNLGNDTIEVSLWGKGKEVVKRKQAFPKGEIIVLGGNAPNSTSWLVVVKRTD